MWAHPHTHAHRHTGNTDTEDGGLWDLEKSQEPPPLASRPVPSHQPSPQGTARPSQPHQATRSPGAQGQPGGRGVSLIVLLVAHPAEETAAGFSLQMTGNAMEGYSASNYYFEKGEKKCRGGNGSNLNNLLMGGGGWEAVSRKRHFEKPSINLTSNYLLSCWHKSPPLPPQDWCPPRKTRAPD